MASAKKDEKRFRASWAGYEKEIAEAVAQLQTQRIVERIWEKDYRVWSASPSEITNRLGWLHSPDVALATADDITRFVMAVRDDGYTHALLLGMGGSSLAAEVFSLAFGARAGYLRLEVLDSTHPGAVLDHARRLDPGKTLYIVASKSGGTVETFSFMKFFYNQAIAKVGRENAGRHFIAITDPGSGLESVARELDFRRIFLNDPDIGGRYAALSLFGIVPAALLGMDIKKILRRAARMARECHPASAAAGASAAARLGAAMGHLAKVGRDKITFITSGPLSPFADWLEQLIAESTGKTGKGILPVVGEAPRPPAAYGADRFFVYLHMQDDHTHAEAVGALLAAGHPVAEISCLDEYDIGGEYFRWEMATAIACWQLGVQPFDQPDVEAAKILARKMLAEYSRQGQLPQPEPRCKIAGVLVHAESLCRDFAQLRFSFFGHTAADFRAKGHEYISIQAYVHPDRNARQALRQLRTTLRQHYAVAVTVGCGPRFLHSTGQLHKGDAGKGLFIQILSRPEPDAPIPDQAGSGQSSVSFAALITAQAFGDRQALLEKKRPVITFQFTAGQEAGFAVLTRILSHPG